MYTDRGNLRSVEPRAGSGRPHTAFTTANIDKVKDFVVITSTDVFIRLRLHLLSRNILSKRVVPYFLLSRSPFHLQR